MFNLNINNIKAVSLGFFLGVLVSAYLSEYFQFIAIALITSADSKIIYNYLLPHNLFTISNTNLVISLSVFLAPQFFLIIVLGLLGIFIKRTLLGFYRYFIIVFNLFVQGFLLLSVFYNSLILILSEERNNDFVNLAFCLNIQDNGKIILAFWIILATVIYLNFTSKKVIKYINY
ncbi:MAG: hypothetical protein PVH88_13670 [Ignavibacteria bacterium]|jgi:hypothetical protein